MNELNSLGRGQRDLRGWRSAMLILVATVCFVGTVFAEDKLLDAAPGSGTAKAAARVSPHVLAAQRRAQQEDETLTPRIGLQSQMHRDAARRHIASARVGA